MKKINKNILIPILIILSTFLLDTGIRLTLYKEIRFVSYTYLPPYIFTLSYTLILLLIYYLKPKLGKITYTIFTILFTILTIAQILHYKNFARPFTVPDIFAGVQAVGYAGYLLKQVDFSMIAITITEILLIIITIKLMNKNKVPQINKKKKISITLLSIILIIFLRTLAYISLGTKIDNNAWNFWDTPKNVYTEYDNPSRSFIISGLYEYSFRDVYTYFRDLKKEKSDTNIEEITKYVNSLNRTTEPNEYTNIFKDKNLIMIMMESIDNWLITEETMPTLYNIKKTGINFTQRFSPTFGGGATINSEFSGITGIYATVTDQPIYFYDENDFSYSLPSLFKTNGYAVNSVHMNNGSFYNRSNFHKALGFENHYALSDIIKDVNFQYDTNLIKNKQSYNYIVNKDQKFMTFITTYSAHLPYTHNELCKNLDTTKFTVKNDEETTCIKTLANETDNFIKLLIEKLKSDNLLEDTIIVLYADHYTYGYSDTSKQTHISDKKLSQNTTFVIWNNNITNQNIDIVNSTVDIPPTLFNMFGIEYNPNLYMGTDIFSKDHDAFAYFNDYTWYSSELYYNGSQDNTKDLTYIKEISNKVNNKIRINEKIITSNFYKYYN